MDVEIPEIVKEEVITKALRVVNLAEDGVNIPFYNIIEMRNILLKRQNSDNGTQNGTERELIKCTRHPVGDK